MEIPPELLLMSVETRIDAKFSGLFVSYLATRDKIAQLSTVSWHDPESSHSENKMRMKELGGAVFSYSDFLFETTIQSLSNIIEDTWIELKKDLRFEYDLWNPTVSVEFEHEARIVRALANVLKHNQGLLKSQTSQHAKFLVTDCGLIDGYEVALFAQGDQPKIVLPELIYRCYIYCWGLAKAAFGNEDGLIAAPDEERKPEVLSYLIPPITGLHI